MLHDEEVMRGVEDFQVQFGYDSGSYDGDATIDAGFDEDGNGIPDSSTASPRDTWIRAKCPSGSRSSRCASGC